MDRLRLPEELYAAFNEFAVKEKPVFSEKPLERVIHSDRLFYADLLSGDLAKGKIERHHFFPSYERNPVDDSYFRRVALAEFVIGYDQSTKITVRVSGENPEDRIFLETQEKKKQPYYYHTTHFSLDRGKRSLSVWYNDNEELDHILFRGESYRSVMGIGDVNQYSLGFNRSNPMEDLLQIYKGIPSTVKLNGGRDIFATEYDGHTNTLQILRSVDGNVKDSLILPRIVNQERLVEDIFAPEVISNPLHADPRLDSSWKHADWYRALEFKWERVLDEDNAPYVQVEPI